MSMGSMSVRLADIPNLGYANIVKTRELRSDERIFKNAQKEVRKSEVRNADWGPYACQNALFQHLVNADPEEMGLIAAKLELTQNYMNNNLRTDSDIDCAKIKTKGDILPAKAELARAHGDAAKAYAEALKTAGEGVSTTIKTTKESLSPIKSIDIAA